MLGNPCHFGGWGWVGSFTLWDWAGLILQTMVWMGLAFGLIFLLISAIRRNKQVSLAGQPSAKDILQVRYAHGEITREQYETMMRDMG